MTYITIKTKETNANIEIFPPIVLNEGSHISLADIEIPEEVTKSFTFTGHQAISGGLIWDNQPAMMTFPKGAYNLLKLQFMVKNNPVYKNIGFDIETIKRAFYVTTKLYEVRSLPKLAEILGIPKILAPFSSVKISGDEKYLINCNLVEANSSYSFGSKVSPSRLLAVAPSRNGRYSKLSIQSGKNIINNLTLEIFTENLETPDFGDNEITYVLQVW